VAVRRKRGDVKSRDPGGPVRYMMPVRKMRSWKSQQNVNWAAAGKLQ